MIFSNFDIDAEESEFSVHNEEELKASFNALPFQENIEFAERIRKTLYYGKLPSEDRPSLPMTGLAVGFLRDAAPKELGKIDMYWAADVGRNAYISPCSLMLGMIYIERLKHKNPDYLNQVSSSDLFLISMMVASKYLYDEGIEEEVYNDEWADAADMEVQDINQLERDFLRAVDWTLFTQQEDFERLLQSMEERIALTQGLDRGGCWTYSDMMVLLNNSKLHDTLRRIMEDLCRVIVVCSIAYTAGTVTVLGSLTTLSLLHSHVLPPLPTSTSFYNQGFVQIEEGSYGMEKLSVVDGSFEKGTENKSELSSGTLPHLDNYSNESMNVSSELLHNEDKPGFSVTGSNINVEETKIGLSFPGFLTLALIKDTVTQFLIATVDGAKGKEKANSERNTENEMQENEVESFERTRCNCATCPLKQRSRSRRKLYHRDGSFRKSQVNSIILTPFQQWGSSVKHNKLCRERDKTTRCVETVNGMLNSRSLSNDVCQNEVTSEMEGDDDSAWERNTFSKFNTDLYEKQIHNGKCPIKDVCNTILPCRIETNFIDLNSRFETSAQAAFAG